MTDNFNPKTTSTASVHAANDNGDARLVRAMHAVDQTVQITATVFNAALVRSRKRYKTMALLLEDSHSPALPLRRQRSDLWTLLQDEIFTATGLKPSEEALTAALLEYQGVTVIPDAQWQQHRIEVPPSSAARYVHVCAGADQYLLSEDPWDALATAALMSSDGSGIRLAIARGKQWEQIFSQHADLGSCVNILEKPQVVSSTAEARVALPTLVGLEAIDVVQFVDDAIAHAAREGASDVHFETGKLGLTVKFRLDGVMSPGPQVTDSKRAEEVVSRIKVMAQLDITESRRPQDGRIHWSLNGFGPMDLRVSVMPSILGEDVVLRLLDKSHLQSNSEGRSELTLYTLGFDDTLVDQLRELAQRPHGMLLVTGPTGSGKTTTVYAALSEANDGLEKIITIEDPVEYQLSGVLQIPVNEQKGLTFATGLRSILRHDPDKILVGEIRDAETAQIAVQSALTGHMVFTTVHANSLFDVLGRFQHFGIEQFALASALNGVVVQRLLRKLCPHCCGSRSTTEKENYKLQSLGLTTSDRFPVAIGCAHCRKTGYKGRFVTAEVHTVSDSLRELIAARASLDKLVGALYPDSAGRLLARAMAKVLQGHTTLEEVRRVVGLV